MCNYTRVEYRCGHVRYTVRAWYWTSNADIVAHPPLSRNGIRSFGKGVKGVGLDQEEMWREEKAGTGYDCSTGRWFNGSVRNFQSFFGQDKMGTLYTYYNVKVVRKMSCLPLGRTPSEAPTGSPIRSDQQGENEY
ncbi:hypothetical protein LHYA1_G002366 [Lachnellula hyalina]|uniref:Uncharacterized protein n=1 Tax=Lachnellula hyalina TaxID=1316788 RepID=A0A8H8R6M3_9HELO|nr:uncharacterized protein LHYA1_G002366 [Lachnellula hyalina]TVY28655.1 hypothetical protein LHYA1_G002366 [Lachnellula hyalina]